MSTDTTTRKHRSTGALPKDFMDPVDGVRGSRPGVARHMKAKGHDGDPVAFDAATSAALTPEKAPRRTKHSKANFEKVTLTVLRNMAKDAQVPGRSSMDRDQLVAALSVTN